MTFTRVILPPDHAEISMRLVHTIAAAFDVGVQECSSVLPVHIDQVQSLPEYLHLLLK